MRFGNNYILRKASTLDHESGEACSFGSIAIKGGILIAVAIVSACASIVISNLTGFTTILFYLPFVIATIVFQIIMSFKPKTARVLSIPYVICEGFDIGIFCALINLVFNSMEDYPKNIGLSLSFYALILTLGIFFVCFLLYDKLRVKISSKFVIILLLVALGLALSTSLFYLISLITSLVSSNALNMFTTIFNSDAFRILAILISVVTVIIAAIYVYFSIQNVYTCVEGGVDKEYEWFIAFGVALSVIWLFLEILKLLLRILASRK